MTSAPDPDARPADSLRSQVVSIAIALVAAGGLAWWLTDSPSRTQTQTQPQTQTQTQTQTRAQAQAQAQARARAQTPSVDEPFELPPPDAVIHLPDLPTATERGPRGALAGAAHLPPHPSLSVGTPQNGHLVDGVDLALMEPLPAQRVLTAPRRRGFTFATAELATLLRDTASALARAFPDTRLAVGNLARRGGGDIAPSVSHNSGRDVDLALFAIDRDGKPVESVHYVRFDATGAAVSPRSAVGRLRFDPARTWAVIRHLLSHPAVVVQWIFVAAPLRNILLDHALRIGEPEMLRARASRVLVQPTDSSPHADHLHVRIACARDDKPQCINGGGRTAGARAAQVDALLRMYHQGTPDERRYARDMLSLPVDGADLVLPPLEGDEVAPADPQDLEGS